MSSDDDQRVPANGDPRDERLRELLEVEPLDDVTRQRLVKGALDATAPPATRRERSRASGWLTAAAAAVVVVALGGGIAALVSRDGDSNGGGASTAADSSESRAEDAAPPSTIDEGELESGRGADDAEPRSAVGPDLGDLGNAPSAGALAGRAERAYVTGETGSVAAPPPSSCVISSADALAYATGSVAGEPATVFVNDDTVAVFDATTCALVTEVAR
jgi:hypothetical protein